MKKLSRLTDKDVRIVYLPSATVVSYQYEGEAPEWHVDKVIDQFVTQAGISRTVTRQQSSTFFASLYAVKNRISLDSLRSSRTVSFKDEKSVSAKYAKAVYLCLDLKLMSLDAKQNFVPGGALNAQDALTAVGGM